MAEEKRVPELRFPEFNGEWKERRLKEITTKIGSGKTPKGGSEVYTKHGIPMIRSLNVRDGYLDKNNLAYIDEETEKSMKNSRTFKNDILLNITGASIGRCCLNTLSNDFSNLNQHVCIIRMNEKFNSHFLSQFMISQKGKKMISKAQSGGSREGLNFNEISKMKIYMPSSLEQQKIGEFFSKLDRQIELEEKKLALLEEQKKGYMQKIFSQELRFKDENGEDYPEWEKVKIKDLTEKTGKKNMLKEPLPIASITNKAGFVVEVNGNYSNTESDIRQYKIVNKKEFGYNPARINVGSYGYQDKYKKLIVSSLYVIFKTNERIEDRFLDIFMSTRNFNKEVIKNLEGSVREYLFYENFGNINLLLPSIEEQKQVVIIMEKLNKQIVVQKKKVKYLMERKKYFLKSLLI